MGVQNLTPFLQLNLCRLKQNGTIQEFFDQLCSLYDLNSIPEDVVDCFVSGLSSELQNGVRLFCPKILDDARCLAKLTEATLQFIHSKSPSNITTFYKSGYQDFQTPRVTRQYLDDNPTNLTTEAIEVDGAVHEINTAEGQEVDNGIVMRESVVMTDKCTEFFEAPADFIIREIESKDCPITAGRSEIVNSSCVWGKAHSSDSSFVATEMGEESKNMTGKNENFMGIAVDSCVDFYLEMGINEDKNFFVNLGKRKINNRYVLDGDSSDIGILKDYMPCYELKIEKATLIVYLGLTKLLKRNLVGGFLGSTNRGVKCVFQKNGVSYILKVWLGKEVSILPRSFP